VLIREAVSVQFLTVSLSVLQHISVKRSYDLAFKLTFEKCFRTSAAPVLVKVKIEDRFAEGSLEQ
jgi:hypothetical protein